MKVVWISHHCHNLNNATLRFNVLPHQKFLEAQGVESLIVQDVIAAMIHQPDVVICMDMNDVELLVKYKESMPRLSVIGFQSDGPTTTAQGFELIDTIVVDSEFLLTRVPAKYLPKTIYIPDTIEFPRNQFRSHTKPNHPLKLVWIGAGGNYFFAKPVIDFLREKGWSVTTVSDLDGQDNIPWTVDGYASALSNFDVGIVPYPPALKVDDTKSFDNFRYKDNNRIVTMQAVGVPIVASPLPSFLTYVEHNRTGLIANHLDDWQHCLEYLQDSGSAYNRMAVNGWEQAWSYADPDVTSRAWHRIIVNAYYTCSRPQLRSN